MSIRRDKNGKYVADVYLEKNRRLRMRFEKRSQADEFISQFKAAKIEEQKADNKPKQYRVTFEKALDDFLLSKQSLRPRTRQKYGFVIGQLKVFAASIGITKLDEFTPDHADILHETITKERPDVRYANGRIIKPKPKTVNFFFQTVRAFFNGEVVKGHLTKSPFVHVRNLKAERKHPEYYSREELKAFFAQPMEPAYRDAFLALLHTGMRIAELENLTWNDIDLEKKTIQVRSKEDFQTKTFYSERTLPMNETLYRLFCRLNKCRLSEVYPFASVQGCQLRERKLLAECKVVAAAAGIKGRAFLHKFRHTYATHLVQRKVPIEAIQKLLGHSSITETLVYAHIKPDDLHKEVELLDGITGLEEPGKDNQV